MLSIQRFKEIPSSPDETLSLEAPYCGLDVVCPQRFMYWRLSLQCGSVEVV
jgi:hypothetical protein